MVSQKGKVKAKKIGRTTITAKVNGKKLRCTVTVIKEKGQEDTGDWDWDDEDDEDDQYDNDLNDNSDNYDDNDTDLNDNSQNNNNSNNGDQDNDNQNEKYKNIEYISDLDAVYYSDQDLYRIFFSLKFKDGTYTDASGTSDIKIVDNNGKELFNNQIDFTENNFSNWTSKITNNNRYLCSIDIKRSSLLESTTEKGTIYLVVKLLDDSKFKECKISIDNLPVASFPNTGNNDINNPDTNNRIPDIDYSSQCSLLYDLDTTLTYFDASNIAKVVSVNYNFEKHAIDPAKVNLKVIYTIQRTQKTYKSFFYSVKLKQNKTGNVISTRTYSLTDLNDGETKEEKLTYIDLEPGDYTLLFERK